MKSIKTNVTCSSDAFWKALKVYIERPNSINKQVIFSENVFIAELGGFLTENECHNLYFYLSETLNTKKDLYEVSKEISVFKFTSNELEDIAKDFESIEGMFLYVRVMVPKYQNNWNSKFYEFLFLDKKSTTVHIYTYFTKPLVEATDPQKDPYTILKFNHIELNFNVNILELQFDSSLGDKGINWLKCIFIPKFIKIMLNNNATNKQSDSTLNFSPQVDVVQYYQLYEKMKAKYAKQLIENWTENTDPKKFVYEDIGIATYLLMLWNKSSMSEEKKEKIKFVDLGCGNGLLVFILNSEGHLGVGLDVRKRKIWDTYDAATILKEETVIPTTDTCYPEADWLIGNHSDELTAWIPIMARRSNHNCQYFVLPCCPYQLNGKKFQRKNSSLSCYQDFINYVKEISELCGFETYVDKLRIPSTKRICLIGQNRQEISQKLFDDINEKIKKFVRNECEVFENSQIENNSLRIDDKPNSRDLVLDFKVRESIESVKNCTKVPQEFLNQILKEIMNILLRKPFDCLPIPQSRTLSWNRGEKMSISELAKNINEELLKKLKEENKGLQTLLKNHHFIFEVNQGFVQFRSPESMLAISRKFLNNGGEIKWKKRFCWFYNNHPDKCPLPDEDCSYKHEIL